MAQIVAKDGSVDLYEGFFDEVEATSLLEELLHKIEWRQEGITIFGEERDLPRLTAWYADPNRTYNYSGITSKPLPWTALLLGIKTRVEEGCGAVFNSVLLNQYRDGNDSVGWHADDEKEFGTNPTIASVSFGETRRFKLKHKTDKTQKCAVDLTHGSLLVMSGATQTHWLHEVPKTKRTVGARVNLTFRLVVDD